MELTLTPHMDFPGGTNDKWPVVNGASGKCLLPANARDIRYMGSIPGSGEIPWRRAWQPTSLFLPGESHGQRRLVDYSPWGHKEN